MQFELAKQLVKLANVNPRAERHGDDTVVAADLKIEASAHRSVLDMFDPAMRPLLFRKPAVGEQQGLLDEDDNLTQIKNPWLGTLVCDLDLTGYVATLSEGTEMSEALVLPADASNFRIDAIEGGVVKLTFRLVCHPSEEEMGRLCSLIQKDVYLALDAPKAEQQKLAA